MFTKKLREKHFYEKQLLPKSDLNFISEWVHRNVTNQKYDFFMKHFILIDRLYTKISRRSYHWVCTRATIRSKKLKVIKIFDCESSFLQRVFLKIVSLWVETNDSKMKHQSFWKNYIIKDRLYIIFWWRSYQWQSRGTIIKKKDLSFIKKFIYEDL